MPDTPTMGTTYTINVPTRNGKRDALKAIKEMAAAGATVEITTDYTRPMTDDDRSALVAMAYGHRFAKRVGDDTYRTFMHPTSGTPFRPYPEYADRLAAQYGLS